MDLRYWIFDMDGTLTVPVHDFNNIKQRLGLAEDQALLTSMMALPEPERAMAFKVVGEWEESLAKTASANPDALALLDCLTQKQARIGVLTRNRRDLIEVTLSAAGILEFVDPDSLLGRECATPKPAPDGVLAICNHWGVEPEKAIMVGDHYDDIEAGLRAGCLTVHILRGNGPVHPNTITCTDLRQLIPFIQQRHQ